MITLEYDCDENSMEKEIVVLMKKSGCNRKQAHDFLYFADVFFLSREISNEDLVSLRFLTEEYCGEMCAFISERTGMPYDLVRTMNQMDIQLMKAELRKDSLLFGIQMFLISMIGVLVVVRLLIEFI